jgi:hypothetical protein
MALNDIETQKYPEPIPYGDEFVSIKQLWDIVTERLHQGLPVYGHAVCCIDGERVAARVSFQGEITVGAHCENI